MHAGERECGALPERCGSKSFAAALDAELKRVLPHIDCGSDTYTVAAGIELRSLADDVRGQKCSNQQKTGSIKIFPV